MQLEKYGGKKEGLIFAQVGAEGILETEHIEDGEIVAHGIYNV